MLLFRASCCATCALSCTIVLSKSIGDVLSVEGTYTTHSRFDTATVIPEYCSSVSSSTTSLNLRFIQFFAYFSDIPDKNHTLALEKHDKSISLFFIYPPLYFIYVVSALLYSSFLENLLLELFLLALVFVDLQHIAHPIHLDRSCEVAEQVLLRVCCIYATFKETVQ